MNTYTGLMQSLSIGAVALVGAVLGIQKLSKGWKESSAESSVITLMHTELERMSKHNQQLTTELNKLQLEVVTLNQELRKLTIENQQLHAEVAALTGEVTRLQIMLSESGGV